MDIKEDPRYQLFTNRLQVIMDTYGIIKITEVYDIFYEIFGSDYNEELIVDVLGSKDLGS